MAKLKVYRTAIGFHDAYVAAPSMKAALAAWGGATNLFSAGMAELVTDAALSEEPLANPGKVVKRVRGSEAEHVAALGPLPAKRERKAEPEREAAMPPPPKPPKPKKPEKLKPRPSRAKLDAAEAALSALEPQQQKELASLAKREAALAEERRRLEAAHQKARDQLDAKRAKAEGDYREALRRWRG